MSDYIYNADDGAMDEWAMNFTNRMGDGTGDHEIAYLEMLRLLIALNRRGSMIDIGCGLGRVTELARGNIDHIVALEPDLVRFTDCHKRFHRPPQCQVLNWMSHEFIHASPDKQFDLVVLGMVIQHISTHACSKLIQDAARLVKPEGTVIIATTLAPETFKGFSCSTDPENSYLNQQEYNDYANNPKTQDRGIPVRRFSKKDLLDEVAPYFDVIQWTQFSYYRPDRIGWFVETLKADVETLKDVGNSQFSVLRRK